MDIRIEQRLAAPIERVQAALVDAAFVARLENLPKIGRAELVSQEQYGDVVEQEIHYVFDAPLSSAVRAVVDPKKISWILESRFDLAEHQATWRIIPDHYRDRLTASGDSRLVADGGATRRLTAGTVTVHMALVGGRVERAIVSGLIEHAEAETVELQRFLDSSPKSNG